MGETTLDLRLLRALRSRPAHGYALAQQLAEDADRATVYRRLTALKRAALVEPVAQRGAGPERRTYRLTVAGQERLRDELRDALRLLIEAFGASARGSGGGGRAPRAPIVFVSGTRLSGVELRIAGHLARAAPHRAHLVVPPGAQVGRAPPGLGIAEGSWRAIPFRDAYAKTLFVNELPPARALPPAIREWARVLAPGGALHVVAPAPLPLGVDPFVDYLARLRDELHPDSADAPATPVVTRALERHFTRIEEAREADQRVWSAVRAEGS